ncbi:MAG: hypothetical protein RR673_08760, partial [Erysipelotrichaceae bacterium]
RLTINDNYNNYLIRKYLYNEYYKKCLYVIESLNIDIDKLKHIDSLDILFKTKELFFRRYRDLNVQCNLYEQTSLKYNSRSDSGYIKVLDVSCYIEKYCSKKEIINVDVKFELI